MTPEKEKAEELYWKYYQLVADGSCPEEKAKNCALNCVDEILNIELIKNAAFEFYEVRNYWKDVKQEIEKL